MTQRDQVDARLAPFLDACDAVLQGAYSAVLFGSAARGEWVEARSNLNVLLVLDDVRPETLRALHAAFAAFAAVSPEPPLLLSRAEWQQAADAFPIEITDMRAAYRVLRGDDPMPLVTVERSHLRQALEREFRGKLLQLRRAFVLRGADELALGQVASAGVGTAVLLCRTALVLLGETPPGTSAGVLDRAAARLGIDAAPLLGALSRRWTPDWRCPAPEFVRYLAAIEAAMHAVDSHPTEER